MKRLTNKREAGIRCAEYAYHDYLQIKTGLHSPTTEKLKELLCLPGRHACDLLPVEGFCFDRHVVLLQAVGRRPYKQVVFLDPATGSLHIRDLA